MAPPASAQSSIAPHDALTARGGAEPDGHPFLFRDGLGLDPVLREQLLRMWRRIDRAPDAPFPFVQRVCAFCRARTIVVDRFEHGDQDDEITDADSEVESRSSFEVCPRCLFWRWHFLDSEFQLRGGGWSHEYTSYASKLADFNPSLPEGCSTELAQWLRRRPDFWDDLAPSRLERFVADVYRANYADADVLHVGKTGDGGVDVLMVRTSGERWLIQVKRRAAKRSARGEGVETLRNLLGAMAIGKARYGAVVSTADHFTYAAHRFAGDARDIGSIIHLVDRAMLDEMIGRLLPADPWHGVLAQRFSLYADWLRAQLPPQAGVKALAKAKRVRVVTKERRLFIGDEGFVVPLRIGRKLAEPALAHEDGRQLQLFANN